MERWLLTNAALVQVDANPERFEREADPVGVAESDKLGALPERPPRLGVRRACVAAQVARTVRSVLPPAGLLVDLDVMVNPWQQRRALLEGLWADCRVAQLADVFDDGQALFDAVVEHDVEGIVAKRRDGIYRPGYRGWTKIKNPGYWRRENEIAQMQRRRERARVPSI